MRAPGEAVGLLALECAMDELAERLGMDPIELRIRNEPTVDPQEGTPFSTRTLVPCMRKGAELFGWEKRDARPGQVRDGEWLVGHGHGGSDPRQSDAEGAGACRARAGRRAVGAKPR